MTLPFAARAFIATTRAAMRPMRAALRVATLDVPSDARARALDGIDDLLRVIAANLDPSSVPPVPTPHAEEVRLGAYLGARNPPQASGVE